ncbi:uncharacterized protein LOC127283937 isoform X2 [Leptopilina boulardi]|uniref:uncharacterized protein LOC127283937 isoform X2 n=1 Tax=Leptopilina boulardi TaxID=63433 RepID=UPI0021F59DA9|nr:uncharacterized protein LOC127283937 isoform X2 [Leptopilina boulardi]
MIYYKTRQRCSHIMIMYVNAIRELSKCRISHMTLFFFALLVRACVQAQDVNTNAVAPAKVEATSDNKEKKEQELICPRVLNLEGRLSRLLSIPCNELADCSIFGPNQRCCKGYCTQGVPPPIKEPYHEAINGFSRRCPKETIPERLPITPCKTDTDCKEGRRICCPDKKDLQLYCRTAAPNWAELPFQRSHATLKTLLEYMQCQPPPENLFLFLSQPCNRTMDCFPNLCCQEGANKFCRPPKKSFIALAAQATNRFIRG